MVKLKENSQRLINSLTSGTLVSAEKCVYSGIVNLDIEQEINTSQWKEGIYFVKYQNETTQINKKIIILHY